MTKDEKGTRKKGAYSVSSAATGAAVSPATVPLAARLATIPSFVTGMYAPPANV
jgi:hypothetical protein